MLLLKRLNIDTFLWVMTGTVVIAAVLPVSGEAAKDCSLATFFLLPRSGFGVVPSFG
ncbi:MAG: hypothetical protein V7760_11400 [Marinobacter sp.]